jgi:hypothetical protein
MPAKTNTDKAHDAFVKILTTRDVNYSLFSDKLWNGPEWQTEQIWTFILAYMKMAEINSRHPGIEMSPAQIENARYIAALYGKR